MPSLRYLAALGAALALAGCAAGGNSPASPSDAAEPRPTPLIDLGCEGLLDDATLASAFSADTVAVELSWYSSGDYYTLAQLGVEQAGALRCEWSDGGGDAERYLQVTVLPGAVASWDSFASELAVYQPRQNEFGDSSFSTCSTSNGYASCRIDSLVGDRWISAILGGLSSVDAAAAVLQSLTASVESAAPADGAWPAGQPRACSELLALDDVRTAVGAEVDEWMNPLPTMAVFHGGFLAAGGTVCQWRNSFDSASAMTVDAVLLPGGAWAWEDNWAHEPHATVTREPLDGLGDAAYSGCSTTMSGDTDCWVSVLIGDDWLSVLVNDESSDDERAVAIQLAERAIELL